MIISMMKNWANMYLHISGREQYPDIGVVSAAASNSIIEETDTVTLFKLQGKILYTKLNLHLVGKTDAGN